MTGFEKAPGRIKRLLTLAFVALAAMLMMNQFVRFSSLAASGDEQDETSRQTTRDDCGYLQNPDGFRAAIARHREEVSKTTTEITNTLFQATELSLVPPQDIPRKNFIDNILFDRMQRDGIQSAPVCTDEEFVRRVYLDLTGRIPAAADVTAFVADKSATKREALIDKLIGSPEYVDKWTMFFGDLFKNNARSVNVTRYSGGRDAFYNYIKDAISKNKPYNQIATEMIAGNGDNFVDGQVNHVIGGIVPMGPPQDTMDGTAVNTASMFLGINALDCLLCHDGAGHLDAVNLWGSQKTRLDAWGMSAYFARVRRQGQLLSQQPLYRKFLVSELAVGEYQLNTDFGNRQTRAPINGQTVVQPKYILGAGTANAGENRRQTLARLLTADKQFARAAVNYIWEKLMVEALVSPSNAFDPARLDPKATLPAGWTLQPANAELLDALADEFIKQNYDLRKLIALIAKSSGYQLSSQYPGTWSLALVPYYARKYVRRMDAEEIHDAIVKATGVKVTSIVGGQAIDGYQLRDTLNQPTWTVNWAMQLPDTIEPRGNVVGGFLNSFIRGDRDVKPRSLEPSIQQALNLMNNTFVLNRIHQTNAGSLVARLLADTTLTNQQIVTQLYLNTLSRNPSQSELDALLPLFSSQAKRDATEGIQWALLNKMDFIFNY
ncbi:MAG TPA: DUF1549 domain-containing protein [Blastocatellia bacterium]|nr:DUF1549 domain-containing protein [Blastocatellia bacterium]HMX26751.1 DUF1549 domain-containing protein [Blastocatellia bacterium]HMZ22648.1 DUF1549 domain-containing protein [Blastocatellia bacterium]HNG33116.1 DUF1549 domain-containing protein [Blastocatellia bacterium]